MFEATDIRVSLNRAEILHGVDFHAAAGAVTAIVGPNGSGKTTLIRALTGDVRYTGTIRLDGEDVAQMAAWQLAERRGVLPQATRLAFPFTVFEVVRIGLTSGPNADRIDLVEEALAKVGLHGFEHRFFHELSGGEQQRAQLARVLVQVWEPVSHGRPSWLLLDEPVASLDIAHQLEVMQLARDYAQAGGGVIAVMHDLNLTAMFADSIALLTNGRLARQDVPHRVLEDETLSDAYGCRLRVNTLPDAGTFLLPHTASAS
ncbi:MAG: heme ABC transporter ATP-binding protein [Pseudomonadota bacterium]